MALRRNRPRNHRLAAPGWPIQQYTTARLLLELRENPRFEERLDDLQPHSAFEVFEPGDVGKSDPLAALRWREVDHFVGSTPLHNREAARRSGLGFFQPGFECRV